MQRNVLMVCVIGFLASSCGLDLGSSMRAVEGEEPGDTAPGERAPGGDHEAIPTGVDDIPGDPIGMFPQSSSVSAMG